MAAADRGLVACPAVLHCDPAKARQNADGVGGSAAAVGVDGKVGELLRGLFALLGQLLLLQSDQCFEGGDALVDGYASMLYSLRTSA